jgi:hypothetical protein
MVKKGNEAQRHKGNKEIQQYSLLYFNYRIIKFSNSQISIHPPCVALMSITLSAGRKIYAGHSVLGITFCSTATAKPATGMPNTWVSNCSNEH